MAFRGGSGLFAAGVQQAVNDKMAVACEDLKAKAERQRKEAERRKAYEASRPKNETGNINAPTYINGPTGGSESSARANRSDDESDEDSSDDDEFLNDPELERIRANRIKQMKKHQSLRKVGFGDYVEITEPEFLKEVTSYERVVCHFFHEEFMRCKIMHNHLKKICRVHADVKFIKLNGEKARFMVQKLNIRTLPTLVFFHNGVAKDRLVGFETLGSADVFPTRILEMRIMAAGIILDESAFGTYDDDERSITEAINGGGDGDDVY